MNDEIKKCLLLVFLIFSPLAEANCDPFTVNCRKIVEALSQYPLSSLSMAGTITKGDKIWAIIATPEGHIYAVTQGSQIGQEGGQVLQISAEEVTVQEEKNQQKTIVTIGLRPVK